MARASDAAEGAALLNPLTRDVHELFLKPKAHELKLLAEGDGVASALSADDVLALVQSVSGAVHCLTAFHQAQDPLAQQWGPEARALAAQAFATWLSDSRLLVHAVAALRAAANTLLHRGGASSLGGPPSDPAVGRNAWHRLAHQLLVLLLTVATAARSFRAPVLIHHALTPAMTEALNAGLLEALSAVFERDPLADWSGALAASADFDKCCSSSGRGPTTESAPLPLAGTAAEYLCWVTCVLHSRAPYGGWHAFCSHLKPSGVLQSMCRHAMAAAALEPDWQRKKKEQLQQQDGGSSSSSSVAWQYPPVAAALLASSAVSILYTLRALTATSSADIAHRLAVFSALASDRAVLDLLLVAADSLLALYPQQQQQQQQPALPPCGSAAALRPLPLALRCEYDITTEPAMLYEGLGLHEPPSPEVARLRGNQCFRYQDYELAAHYYSLALEMKPGDVTITANRAAAYLKLSMWREAEADCDAVLAAEPGHLKALLRRMAARAELGDVEAACADARVVLQVEPDNSEALTMVRDVESGTRRRRVLFDLSHNRTHVGVLAQNIYSVLSYLMGVPLYNASGCFQAEQAVAAELGSGRHMVRLLALLPHTLLSDLECGCCGAAWHEHVQIMQSARELARPWWTDAKSAVGPYQAARAWLRAGCHYVLRQVYVAQYVEAEAAGGDALPRFVKRVVESGADVGLAAFAVDSGIGGCSNVTPSAAKEAPGGEILFCDPGVWGFGNLLMNEMAYRKVQVGTFQRSPPSTSGLLPMLTASHLMEDTGPLRVLLDDVYSDFSCRNRLFWRVLDTDAPLLLRVIEAAFRLDDGSRTSSGGGGKGGGSGAAPAFVTRPVHLSAARLLHLMVVTTSVPAAWLERVDSGGPAARRALRGLVRTTAKVAQRLTQAPSLDSHGQELLIQLRRICALLPSLALFNSVRAAFAPPGSSAARIATSKECVDQLLATADFVCSRQGIAEVGNWCQQQMWLQLGMRALLLLPKGGQRDAPVVAREDEQLASTVVQLCYGSWDKLETNVVRLLDEVMTASAEAAGIAEEETPVAPGGSCQRPSVTSPTSLQPDHTLPHMFAFKPFGCWSASCTNLSGASEALLRVRKCARCGQAAYCCTDCQRADWPRHKQYCRAAVADEECD